MATKKPVMIYIHCWRCGAPFSIKESDYTHKAGCGKC